MRKLNTFTNARWKTKANGNQNAIEVYTSKFFDLKSPLKKSSVGERYTGELSRQFFDTGIMSV